LHGLSISQFKATIERNPRRIQAFVRTTSKTAEKIS
jgi:hypothetical protein